MAIQLKFQTSQELLSDLQTMMWISNNNLSKKQVSYVRAVIDKKSNWLGQQNDKKIGQIIFKISDCENVDNDLQLRLQAVSKKILENYTAFKAKTSELLKNGMHHWLGQNIFDNRDWISSSRNIELLTTIKEAVNRGNLGDYEPEIVQTIDTALTRYLLRINDPLSEKKRIYIQKLIDQQSDWLTNIVEKEPRVAMMLNNFSK